MYCFFSPTLLHSVYIHCFNRCIVFLLPLLHWQADSLPLVPPGKLSSLQMNHNLLNAVGREPTYQCRRLKRLEFDPWIGKIPWRGTWQPTPVFLPGKSHGQRSLAGHSPWGHKESDTTEHTCIKTYRLCFNF